MAGSSDECSAGYALGIDEAGRGALLGPMVVAGVAVCRDMLDKLWVMGVDDSKALERGARSRLVPLIEKLSALVVRVYVPPSLIDATNLNVIERNTMAFIVGRGVDLLGDALQEVYIDAVGDAARIVSVIRRVGFRGRVVVEPKADSKYPVVAAASIIAKVYRDAEIDRLRREYGVRGSGYPSDPETLAWVREAYASNPSEPPQFLRRTWGTLKRIAPRWYRDKKRASRQSRQLSLLDFV